MSQCAFCVDIVDSVCIDVCIDVCCHYNLLLQTSSLLVV